MKKNAASFQPERDPMEPVNFPLTFDQWLKQPFMSYHTSFQTTWKSTGKFDRTTRFYQLNEKEMQEFAPGQKKKIGSKMRRKKSSRTDGSKILKRFQSDRVFPEMFRLCQQGDVEMVTALGNQSVRYCEHIFLLAEEGNPLAAKYLAEMAVKATKGLEQVAANHYETLRGVAAIEYAWPMMTSPVKTLSSAPLDWAQLGLGTELNLDLNDRRRFELNTPVGKLAWKLVNYIANLKYYHTALGVQDEGVRGNGLSIEQQAAALPTLSKDSLVVSKWWMVAEHCLVESYPSPNDKNIIDEKNAVFDGIAPEKDQRTPYRHRSRIIERLSGAFDSIAGFNKAE